MARAIHFSIFCLRVQLLLVLAVLAVLSAAQAAGPNNALASVAHSPHKPPAQRGVTKIALEEHVGFRSMWPLFNHDTPPLEWYQHERELTDLEDGRLAERIAVMDKANIAVMILSLSGDTQAMKNKATAAADIRAFNQKMADAVSKYPKRFKFWCTLPMFDVNASIAELEWCMSKPSCPGALINGYSTDGRNATPNYYDSRAYDPFWSKVQQLKAKMYFHPRSAEARPMWAEYPELMNSPWGFSLETGEHMLRFILGGFFDRFPGVTFIIGHNGEMLAYWANRIDHRLVTLGWKKGVKPTDPEQGLHVRNYTVQEALSRHFYVTTSGMFNDAGLRHVIDVMGIDRVLFSVDYPYENALSASAWFDSATAKMRPEDVQKIASGNAARLFGITL